MSTQQVIDITCVQCLVGRTPTVTNGRTEYAIIDRSGYLGGAIYAADEA